MKCDDIVSIVNRFQKDNDRDLRYASFDYCYNYFRYNSKDIIEKDIEKSCAIVGFYLASWGMLRASSFLLKKSYRYYIPLIKYIAGIDKKVWKISPSEYLNINIQDYIIKMYNEISKIIIEDHNQDKTLVTKIMLGVFGILPAYDENFCKTFKLLEPDVSKFAKFNRKSLIVIGNFYRDNKDNIEKFSNNIWTYDFYTGRKKYRYSCAKIIDMYGFEKGRRI